MLIIERSVGTTFHGIRHVWQPIARSSGRSELAARGLGAGSATFFTSAGCRGLHREWICETLLPVLKRDLSSGR
jgi:hypothetical protein